MGKRQTIKHNPMDALPDDPLDLVVPRGVSREQKPSPSPREETPADVEPVKRKVGYQFADEVYWLVKRMAYWERENPSEVAERLLRQGVEAVQEARGQAYAPHPDEDVSQD